MQLNRSPYNATATIQIRQGSERNPIGESLVSWKDLATVPGFLDHLSGKYDRRNLAKIPNTTELFVCGFLPLQVAPDECRIIIAGTVFDVLLIDDPMFLHDHLEIYLKNTNRKENEQC